MEKSNSIGHGAQVHGVSPSCIRCAFAVKIQFPNEIHTRYECRCAPPQAVPAMIQEGEKSSPIACRTAFPLVLEGMWCFQFAPRGEGV